jgi:hypothetical protein
MTTIRKFSAPMIIIGIIETIRGLKVRTKPYFIGFTTKYVEPCFHIPVIVQHSYLYNLISKQSNSKYSKSNNS